MLWLGMTKYAAMDMAPNGVPVNSIAPRTTRAEMADAYFRQMLGVLDAVRKMIPMDRIADPSETAEALF
jgi:NAD(P)-dependent dehydrogenase (short-subunit alcohol dehydrogenase family)